MCIMNTFHFIQVNRITCVTIFKKSVKFMKFYIFSKISSEILLCSLLY